MFVSVFAYINTKADDNGSCLPMASGPLGLDEYYWHYLGFPGGGMVVTGPLTPYTVEELMKWDLVHKDCSKSSLL